MIYLKQILVSIDVLASLRACGVYVRAALRSVSGLKIGGGSPRVSKGASHRRYLRPCLRAGFRPFRHTFKIKLL